MRLLWWQGRLKLFGTIVYPKNKYITLNFVRGAGSIQCEDLFESLVLDQNRCCAFHLCQRYHVARFYTGTYNLLPVVDQEVQLEWLSLITSQLLYSPLCFSKISEDSHPCWQVVFSEVWWIGTKVDNPDELRLDMPLDLQQVCHTFQLSFLIL